MNTRRDFTVVGKEHNGTPELKKKLSRVINKLTWRKIGKGISVGMMPGLGIKKVIKELGIPKVSHVAISHGCAPYGFYGIRGHYANGDADVYVIDEGSNLFAVAMDFTPKGE